VTPVQGQTGKVRRWLKFGRKSRALLAQFWVEINTQSYVRALRRRWQVTERTSTPVHAIRRQGAAIVLRSSVGEEHFDQVVLACHADDALNLLSDASELEREVLGAISYGDNEAILHTDVRVLPTRRKAWAAWNAHVSAQPGAPCSVSYWMNELQSLDAPEQFIVTLNRSSDIDPARILRRLHYRHPQQDHASVAAQSRKHEIQGVRGTWFAGAGWGFGFHEDGIRSGVEMARQLGVQWP